MDPAEDITFIKLDVEGHELKALLGSKKIIEKQKPIIMFEQHKNDFINGSTDVIELLRDFGYKSFVIVKRYPSSRFRSIKLLRYAYSVISRIVFSPSICLELVEKCEPEFYPFIAAMPDWCALKAPASRRVGADPEKRWSYRRGLLKSFERTLARRRERKIDVDAALKQLPA